MKTGGFSKVVPHLPGHFHHLAERIQIGGQKYGRTFDSNEFRSDDDSDASWSRLPIQTELHSVVTKESQIHSEVQSTKT